MRLANQEIIWLANHDRLGRDKSIGIAWKTENDN